MKRSIKHPKFILVVALLILVSALFLRLTGKGRIVVPDSVPAAIPHSAALLSAAGTNIIISSPLPDTTVASPVIIEGQAPGSWFFEASLPVSLEDASGTVIAAAPASAQGDWQVDRLVPFMVTLPFTTTATSGYLVISKDNPSGLPQNADSVKIPVRF
jgi:hypothetical protein